MSAPVNVLLPFRVSVPVPALMRAPVPLITPERVVLLAVVVVRFPLPQKSMTPEQVREGGVVDS